MSRTFDASLPDATHVAAARVPFQVDTVARQFGRRAERLGLNDVLLREVGQRLLDRLAYIRLAPGDLLDVGCGLGRTRAGLLARFPQARWTGVEIAAELAAAGRAEQRRALGLSRWWREPPRWVVADGGQLPFAEGAFDLVFSNLMLHWHPSPHRVFPEWKRVLRPQGLVLFSCFGPDTLRELRVAAREALPRATPMPFIDMHDFGDMLVASGFASPVMDVEVLTLTFPGARELLAEVRALGANPRTDRASALPSGRQARRMHEALEAQRDAAGRIALTFEIAYGHAWKPEPRNHGTHKIAVDVLREQLARRRQ